MSTQTLIEIDRVDNGTIAAISKSEIDIQIATAHKFRRSITQFRQEVETMATMNEAIAAGCVYALPRDGKTVEGPSVRFAELIASAWGNSRYGARVVSDDGRFITAQGVFHDLERNVAVSFDVQRRVTNKSGKRFSDDMIVVTGNAAASIALRNAILRGIPKTFWADLYDKARQVAMGDVKTLANRRGEAIKALSTFGVLPEQIFAKLGLKGEADIGQEHLLILRSLFIQIREGEIDAGDAFRVEESAPVRPAAPPRPTESAPLAIESQPQEQAPLIVDQETGEISDPAPVAQAVDPAPAQRAAPPRQQERHDSGPYGGEPAPAAPKPTRPAAPAPSQQAPRPSAPPRPTTGATAPAAEQTAASPEDKILDEYRRALEAAQTADQFDDAAEKWGERINELPMAARQKAAHIYGELTVRFE